MKIDNITLRMIKEVKLEIFQQKGLDVSEEEITDIVDSQFRGTVFGLKKGVSIILPNLGRFLFNNRSDTLRRIAEFKSIREFYSEIEYNQMDLEARIATIKRNKARWVKERETELTVLDVVRKPNISNGKIIYDKLSKLIKDGE